jgi:hypothetical protein
MDIFKELFKIVDKRTYLSMGGQELDDFLEVLSADPAVKDMIRTGFIRGYKSAQADLIAVLEEEVKSK